MTDPKSQEWSFNNDELISKTATQTEQLVTTDDEWSDSDPGIHSHGSYQCNHGTPPRPIRNTHGTPPRAARSTNVTPSKPPRGMVQSRFRDYEDLGEDSNFGGDSTSYPTDSNCDTDEPNVKFSETEEFSDELGLKRGKNIGIKNVTLERVSKVMEFLGNFL